MRSAGGRLRLCCAVLSALAATAAVGQQRPRYQLPRGEAWTYERQIESARDGRTVHTARQVVRIWFLDTRADDADLWIEISPVGDDRGIVYAAPMTLDRAGRRRSPPECADRITDIDAALEMFPGLAPALGATERWESQPDANGRIRRQNLAESGAPGAETRVQYEVIDREGVDGLCGRVAAGEYAWDNVAGRVREVEERVRLTAPPVETVVRCRFTESTTFGDTWRGRRIHEIGRYLAGVRLEAAWFARAERESIAPDSLLANLDRIWMGFLQVEPKDDDSPVRRAAESRRRELRAQAGTLRERARMASQWIGTQAAPWSLLTLGGDTLKSETQGRRGLIEVFWSARSAPSLRSLAAIRTATAAAAEREVAIVCINLDTDMSLARGAIDACGRGLTHVLSGPPIGGESPTDLPIVRCLDAERRVVRVIFGRRASLEKVVAEVYAR